MSRSLGFGTLSRRSPSSSGQIARPDGPVLWLHATSDVRLSILCDMAAGLMSDRPDLNILTTYDPSVMEPAETLLSNVEDVCDIVLPLPSGGGGAGRQLIQTWKPDVGLWTGGFLSPGPIRAASDAGTELILLDACTDGFQGRKRRWFSDPLHDALNRFSHVFADGNDSAELLRRAGLAPSRVEIIRPMRKLPSPPTCPDEEVVDVSAELAGRPVWLAAHTDPDEFGYVVSAHRNAVRHAHRLLLVIVIEDRQYLEDLLGMLEAVTLRHRLWHLGEPIDDQLQVIVAEDPEDLGLWYRIAPQTFIGHSLVPDGHGRCPLNAAALGSAVLHGPHVGGHAEAYYRLTAAGAAQLVPDGHALGVQVARLIAPDLAASMALAGWDVATEGAEVLERVAAIARAHLDNEGPPDEGA